MTGQYTPIISIDYNSLQSRIAQVLGVGSGNYGYGQNLKSSQSRPRSAITRTQWNNLREDVLKARQHQTGVDESGNVPPIIPAPNYTATPPVLPTRLITSDIQKFADIITLIENDRLVTPPSNQATRENISVITRTVPWNNVLTYTVDVQYASEEAARWYFNTGSTIEFSAIRVGGTVNVKNQNWSDLLSSMGTITFDLNSTSASGTGTGSAFGYYNLPTTDELIFRKTADSGTYSANRYSIYARIGNDRSAIIFTIEIADNDTGITDENIDGTLTNTVQVYRASGTNVSVPRPGAPLPLNPDYYIAPQITSIGEGQIAVDFIVTTQDVPNGTLLYWTTSTTLGISSADFTDNVLSGSVLIYSDTATIPRAAIADQKTEGTESFYLELRADSIGGPVLAVSDPVQILDLSTDPIPPGATYEITPDATILVEGAPEGVTFFVNTTGVPDGTTLFWSTSATAGISAADFTDNTLVGTVTIKNNTGSFKRVTTADLTTEGSEVFFMELRTGSTSGTVVASSITLLILDISLTPSLSLDSYPLYVDEGGALTVELNAFFIPTNKKLYLTFSGSATETDLNQLSGPTINSSTREFVYTESPTLWTFEVLADRTTEGTENIVWQVRSDSKTGTVLAESPSITINDTSRTPIYTLQVNPSTINEGGTVTTTLTMQNVSVGTTLYLKLDTSSQATSLDLTQASGPSISGDYSFSVTSTSLEWTHTIVADSLTEGTELFNWVLATDAAFSKVVATSNTVTIQDTSLSPTEYQIVPFPVEVVEGELVTGNTTYSIMDSPIGSLVACWAMDEADGITLNDKVDSGNQVATGGTFGWATINGKSAASFNGNAASFAQVKQDSEGLKLTSKPGSSYTIEAWIYPTGPGQDSVYGGEIINHDRDFEVARRPNGQIMVASDWGIGTDINLPGGGWIIPPAGVAVAPLNTATHVAVVIENTVLKIYINGALVWTKTGLNRLRSNSINNKTFIGNRRGKTAGFKGYINSLRVWNIARTATQIQTWYNTIGCAGVQAIPTVLSSAGNSVQFNISSKNVPNNTKVYWSTLGVEPGLNSFDFTDNLLDGEVIINDNKGVITRTMTADATLEGEEHFTISLYSDEALENILATSPSVTVLDSSVKAAASIEYTRPGPNAYAPFTVPSGVTSLLIEMAGGGGSGGYSWRDNPQCGGGGGGSGGFITRTINVTPGQPIHINVGAGGAASLNEVEYNRNGQTTSITIADIIGTVTYGGTPYPPIKNPWPNSLMKSYAVWLSGLYQRNIMRWDLYITTTGNYTIKGVGDDQMTMWIDGNVIFNAVSGFKSSSTPTVVKQLTAGLHTIIISGKDTVGGVSGVAATIQTGTNIIWHTRMGPDASISAGTIHVSGGLQGNDGMKTGNVSTAGRGGLRGMPAGQDGTIGERVANNANAHPGQTPAGTAWGGTAGTSHYGPGGEGGKGTQGQDGRGYGAGGGGAGAPQKIGSTQKVYTGGNGIGGYIKISWG
jgi:hypothetical protein